MKDCEEKMSCKYYRCGYCWKNNYCIPCDFNECETGNNDNLLIIITACMAVFLIYGLLRLFI